MNYSEELLKWENILDINNDNYLKKEIKKCKKNEILLNNFFKDLKCSNEYIYGDYGVGYNKINFITIKQIIDILTENNWDSKKYFLISYDGNELIKNIIELLNKYNDKKIKFLTFSNYEGVDKKFFSFIKRKLNIEKSIYISKSIYKSNTFNITIWNSDEKLKNNKLNEIINKLSENKKIYFEKTINDEMNFLNNDLIMKIFVDNISKISYEKKSLSNLKIAISNRSENVTKILTKLLGFKNFSYVINNKPKNKDISLYDKKKYCNDFLIKKYFKSEINFAKRKKANLLISFNKEGSQLYLFLINKKNVLFLNSNKIVLYFLDDFYKNLEFDNKKIENVYISTNENPNDNILKLIEKYKIDFKKIENCDFISNDYLLIYWNNYNQIIFGEKINDEFSIYHIIVKLLFIIDYYFNQYNSLLPLINNIEKKYEKMKSEFVLFTKKDFHKIVESLNEESDFSNIKINNYENVVSDEINICEFIYKKKYKTKIKHNNITNKTIICFYENEINNYLKNKIKIIKYKHFFANLLE